VSSTPPLEPRHEQLIGLSALQTIALGPKYGSTSSIPTRSEYILRTRVAGQPSLAGSASIGEPAQRRRQHANRATASSTDVNSSGVWLRPSLLRANTIAVFAILATF
jgi:hypothetical protein